MPEGCVCARLFHCSRGTKQRQRSAGLSEAWRSGQVLIGQRGSARRERGVPRGRVETAALTRTGTSMRVRGRHADEAKQQAPHGEAPEVDAGDVLVTIDHFYP